MYNAFHLRFQNCELLPNFKRFIKEVLKPAKINMIVLEINDAFVYEKHPELDGGEYSLTKEDVQDLVRFSKNLDIEIVPLIQCLGHQGWGGSRNAFLTAYPEFDETPEVPLDAQWPEIFCRSWCPQHPDVNPIVFEMMDELIEAFSSKYFHIGMDEVYEIASDQCERCRGGDRAELFSIAVNDMYDYLTKEKNQKVMMWGDRLIDAEKFGYDNWEGDIFGTFKAIDSIPKDIILLDWHYDERKNGYPTPEYFMKQGFSVMPACWFKENVAKQLFSETNQAAIKNNMEERYFGKIVTSWNGWNATSFLKQIEHTQQSFTEFEKEDELGRLNYTIRNVYSM